MKIYTVDVSFGIWSFTAVVIADDESDVLNVVIEYQGTTKLSCTNITLIGAAQHSQKRGIILTDN